MPDTRPHGLRCICDPCAECLSENPAPPPCEPGCHSMFTLHGHADSPKDVCWDCAYEVRL